MYGMKPCIRTLAQAWQMLVSPLMRKPRHRGIQAYEMHHITPPSARTTILGPGSPPWFYLGTEFHYFNNIMADILKARLV